jgi:hypothetical protein
MTGRGGGDHGPSTTPGPVRTLALAGAFIWLSLLWALPVEPSELHLARLAPIALEIAALFALLALIQPLRRGWSGRGLGWLVSGATALIVLLKLAELVIRSSLGRPLDPLLDLDLVPSIMRLLTGTLGGALGWLALAGLSAIPIIVFLISLVAVRTAQRGLEQRDARLATLAGAAVVALLLLGQQIAPQAFTGYRAVSTMTSQTLLDEWRRGVEGLAELATFKRQAANDAFARMPREQLLSGLGNADVLLVYFESYGRSALEEPRYAATILRRLRGFETQLAGHGLHAASGYLTSPTMGGQSWLAHGTLESGLWIDNQSLYDRLVAARDRLTLTRAFAEAGHRTVTIRPAITLPWPEGKILGFQQIYAAKDLGYRGKPYNWITMPDQYTLAEFERRERAGPHPPLYAEMALISSHAPWTPVPPVLEDWSAIGNGKVFSRWAEMGDPPEVVWRDPERVRQQYTQAIDYVLGVLASYATHFVDQRTLLIVVGDHQPAPLITGEGAGRDVPIHVISGPAQLLEPFLAWGLRPGMVPAPDQPVRRMDQFRDWFLGAFSRPAGTPTAHAAS